MKYLLAAFTTICLAANAQQMTALSPDGNIRLSVSLSANGDFTYTVTYKTYTVILPSSLRSCLNLIVKVSYEVFFTILPSSG